MKLPSFSFLIDAFARVCIRFPFAMVSAFIGVGCLMLMIQNHDSGLTVKHWLIAQLALPFFVALTAFSESRGWKSNWRHWALQGAGLLLLGIYYMFFPDPKAPGFEEIHGARHGVLLLTAHLFVAFAPYLNRLPVADFWEYNKQLFANIVIGAVYTFILWAGLSLAILAVDQLFDLKVAGEIYLHLFVLLAGVFNTVFFLAHFPQDFDLGEQDLSYNVVFKNLCKFILIPIVGLYFLILYAYSAKILLTWTLPRGWVASLVIGFSVAGIFTYLLNYLLPKYDDSGMPAAYRRWFWWVMLPMVVLLFASINRRIGDYGVTEPRYFVVLIGLWLAGCGLYFIFSKQDNIKFIPVSLAVVGLLAVLGPFSAFSVAERSQVGLLKELLEKNGRLADGKVKQNTAPVPETEAQQIQSGLDFLDRRDRLTAIQAWLPMLADSFPEVPDTYDSGDRIAAWLGVKTGSIGADDFRSMTVTIDRNSRSGDLRGYTNYYDVMLNGYGREPVYGRYFALRPDQRAIVWRENKNGTAVDLDVFLLDPFLKQWVAQSANDAYSLSGDENVEIKGKKADIRALIHDLRYEYKKDSFKIIHMDALILLREKGR